MASSRIRIGGSLSSARAIERRCRSPPESVRPRSPTIASSPPGWRIMISVAWARASAAITSPSVASGLPTRRFSRIVRAKSIGSWKTTPMLRRSEATVTSRMSTPSTRMRPDCGSNARWSRPSVVDLPDPVAPTNATVSPGCTSKDRSLDRGPLSVVRERDALEANGARDAPHVRRSGRVAPPWGSCRAPRRTRPAWAPGRRRSSRS